MILRNVFREAEGILASWEGSDYSLVLPASPNEYEKKAAGEFKLLLGKGIGRELPVLAEEQAKGDCNIFLGKTKRAEKLGLALTYAAAGSDGYYIRSDGKALVIAGADRGTLFGVYGFFERALGYRYYAQGEMKIASADRLPLYEADVFEKPDIDARSFGYHDVYHIGFPDIEKNADRLRIARNNYTDWIMAGHTYFALIPKEKYQKDHPDWYSPDGANLCLTAKGLEEEFAANVIEKIKATEGRYFMIGQEDNFTFCGCPHCRAEIEKYGSASAVMMRFANGVARRVGEWMRKNCPEREVQLVTFAYNATSAPPVRYDSEKDEFLPVSPDVVAEKNLSVMYIPLGTLHNYPYTHEKNRIRAEGFRGWNACTKSIFVWDYCANFDNFLVEFNDYDVIAENYRFFRDMGVEYLFDQGPYNTRTPCFDELKVFLHANLAWDSEGDTEALIDEFMGAYYKDIAPQMRRYLDMMRGRWKEIAALFGEDMRSGGCDSSYYLLPKFFPKEFLDDCMDVFTEARGALEEIRIEEWDRYVLLKKRLKQIMISVRFLLVKIYGRYYGKELPVKIDNLRADMNDCGIVKTNEGDFMEIC